MRRQDRKVDRKEAIKILEKGEYGVLSTVNQDGYSYGVPLSYTYLENCIYFHCALEGHKLSNIKNNNKVSFCVVGDVNTLPDKFSTDYESVIVFGIAEEIDGEEKIRALTAMVGKYSKDYLKEGEEYINRGSNRTKVVKISIENITGKSRK